MTLMEGLGMGCELSSEHSAVRSWRSFSSRSSTSEVSLDHLLHPDARPYLLTGCGPSWPDRGRLLIHLEGLQDLSADSDSRGIEDRHAQRDKIIFRDSYLSWVGVVSLYGNLLLAESREWRQAVGPWKWVFPKTTDLILNSHGMVVFHGHLRGPAEKRFGYQLTFFDRELFLSQKIPTHP